MRILAACSLGGAGHLNPLVQVLEAARRRGDEVLVSGPPAIGTLVEEAGFAFRAGGEPTEDEVGSIRDQLPVVSAAEASVLGNRELFGRLAARAMVPGMEQAFREWSPDLVLRDPCEYSSAVVAHRAGTPWAQVAISLAEVEAGSIRTAAPALEEYGAGVVDALFAAPYLTRFPESLDPSPFPATVRYRTGGPVEPLPEPWPGGDGPLIYVSFGTVLGYMSTAADVFRVVLKSVTPLRARVLLTVGRKIDVSTLGPVPEHVRVESWIDQTRVLHGADLVVCHGGSGTVLGGLQAGVPIVAVPLFADQFENGRRIAAAGAGLIVESRDEGDDGPRSVITEQDAAAITEAIEAVLADGSYRGNAAAIAAEMAGAPEVGHVISQLGGTMEHGCQAAG